MNIQYAAIISETPDVPHIGPPSTGEGGGKSSPTKYRWSRVALCPRDQWDQTWTWAKHRKTLFRQPSRRTPIRCVGALFRNNRAIPKSIFWLTKHTSVGEVGTNNRRGRTEEYEVYFANVSAYSEFSFNSILSWIDCTDVRLFPIVSQYKCFFKNS